MENEFPEDSMNLHSPWDICIYIYKGQALCVKGNDLLLQTHCIFTLHQYYWSGQVKQDELGEVCSTHRSVEKCIQNFVWKPERKKPVRRSRHKLEYNIRMDVRELCLEAVDWMFLA